MTVRLGDTYFVEVHWHFWSIILTTLAIIAAGFYWKLRKR